jgi:hypothetical protein
MPSYTTLSEAVNLPTGRQATCNGVATLMIWRSAGIAWSAMRAA